MKLRGAAEPQAIHAKIEAVSVPCSVAELADALINISAANGRESAIGILAAFGDDVDDAVDSVSSPDRTAGAANHLDSLDILQKDVLKLPIDASKQRRIDAAAVNEHEHGLRELAAKPAYAYGPVVRVDPGHFHARHHSQDFRHACGSGAADVLLGYHVDRRRSVPDFLGFF